MPLKFIVDTLDAIPEEQRGFYAKGDDGKFRLDLDGYEDPVGLKSALDKERRAARDAARDVAAWKALGKTPEEIQALLEAQAQADKDKLAKAGEWDKLREQMTQAHQGELAKKDERISALTGTVERHLVDAAAANAISAAKGAPALLLPHVRASVKVIEEGGEFKVRIVDDKGNPRVNGKGEFLSIADLVGEMRQSDVYGRAFEADGTTGSGAPQNKGNGGDGGTKKASQMTPDEKAAYIAANGNDKWAAKVQSDYAPTS